MKSRFRFGFLAATALSAWMGLWLAERTVAPAAPLLQSCAGPMAAPPPIAAIPSRSASPALDAAQLAEAARQDPEGTLQRLAQTRLSTQEADSLRRTVVRGWIMDDVHKAAAWIDGQPASPAKDCMVEQFILDTHHAAPEVALLWAEQIADPARRGSALQVLRHYHPGQAQ
jgi:hypothetical protein